MGCGGSAAAPPPEDKGKAKSEKKKSEAPAPPAPPPPAPAPKPRGSAGAPGSAYQVPPSGDSSRDPLAQVDPLVPQHSSHDILQEDLEAPQPEAQKLSRSLSNSHMQRRRRSLRAKEHKQKLGHFIAKGGKKGWDDEEGTPEEKLCRLFDILDEDGGGTIDLNELQGGLERLGFQHSRDAITQMFALADQDGGGDIDRDEFSRFFKGLVVASGHDPGDDDYDEGSPRHEPLKIRDRREYAPGTRPLQRYSVKTFVGHCARVKCIAAGGMRVYDRYSGLRVYCSCDREDAVMHLHDLDSGKEMRSFVAHQDTVMAVALSPNKKHVATASRDGLLIVWDITCGSVVKELEHPGVVTCCAFSPEGKCVVTGCQDNLARRWSVAKGRLAATGDNPTQEKGIVVAIAYSPSPAGQETVAITRSRETSVRILDATSLLCRFVLGGHAAMLWSVCFSADGRRLLSSCERYVKVWDAPSPQCWDAASPSADHGATERQSFCVEQAPCAQDQHRPRIWTTACFCPGDFTHLVCAVSSDSSVHFMHALEGTNMLTVSTRAPVYCVGCAPECNELCCGDEHGNVYRLTLH